jgi:GGDEF domain-containing protein
LPLLGAVLASLAMGAAAPPSAADAAPMDAASVEAASVDAASIRLALASADTDTRLEQILDGSARVGFNPILARGTVVAADPAHPLWLRLRVEVPDDGRPRVVLLPRQGLASLRMFEAGPPVRLLAQAGVGVAPDARWPDRFALAVGGSGRQTLYMQAVGHGWLDLQPQLEEVGRAQSEAAATSRAFDLLYASLFLLGVAALVRRGMSGDRTLRVAAAAFACLGASLVANQHLQLRLGGIALADLALLAPAGWIFACTTLLWATQQYAGLEKNYPEVARAMDRAGFALLALALAVLFLPARWLPLAQLGALGVLGLTALSCAGSLMFDNRQWRWVATLLWFVLVGALAALWLAMQQVIPESPWARRGFEFVLALQLANYLLLPWGRQLWLRRSRRRQAATVELSAEQKIAHARDWMISSLQSGIETGADGDMEWIAYRRLMGGLKSVLPQTGAAVIAMNYHNEDLLLSEPKLAEPRFQMLLAQRGSLLKNLSRSMGPQQIGLDFNGPEGPLQQVLLAVIPLPIERPGWGLLVIERSPQVSYSDDELALCTEFAALATTAGDEAAEAMQRRRGREIDRESGAYRPEMLESLLQRAHALAMQKRRPLSVMRLAIDGYAALPPELAAEAIRIVADLVRDESEYGESLGRTAPDGFLVLLPGRPIGDARALGERLCAAVRKLALPVTEDSNLGVSIGVSQMHSSERLTGPLLDRAARALGKARQYGGNQVQAIAGANSTP